MYYTPTDPESPAPKPPFNWHLLGVAFLGMVLLFLPLLALFVLAIRRLTARHETSLKLLGSRVRELTASRDHWRNQVRILADEPTKPETPNGNPEHPDTAEN